MRLHRPLHLLVCGFALVSGAAFAQGTPDRSGAAASDDPSPHSDVTWLETGTTAVPGQPFTGAIRIRLDAGWHTYWHNGGDAGLPLAVDWTLPRGTRVNGPAYPTPTRLPQPPLMSYGYEREVLFPVTLTIPASAKVGERFRGTASVEWLVCADVCLPAREDIAIDIPIAALTAGSTTAAPDIAKWVARVPVAWQGETPRLVANATAYRLGIPLGAVDRSAWSYPYFFPDSTNRVQHAAPQTWTFERDTLWLTLPRPPRKATSAGTLSGTLVADASKAAARGYLLKVRVESDLTALTTNLTGYAEAASHPEPLPVAGDDMGLALALLLAFVGGLILNIMPCVFPVLSIKVLGLLEHGMTSAQLRVKHGAMFTGGVVATAWLLAALLLIARAGGESLGWGFQMQSPGVVAALALLVLLLGLNLSGVFEIGLTLTRVSGPRVQGAWDSFFSGVLAVVVATPCTAPFMGAALGYALVQPPVTGMLVFTALALGLAAPFVLLLARPAWLARLPKPGPWLETVKQLLAFPLYLTMVWLLWVLAQQSSVNASGMLGLLAVLLAFGAWLFGRAQRHQSRSGMGAGAAIMLTATVVAVVASSQPLPAESPVTATASSERWQPFTRARFDSLQQARRVVFVDYSAAWCLSCQVNERLVLDTDATQRAFANAGIITMRADWTRRDASITEMLSRHGRSGVPLYVLYPADPQQRPIILPTVLTNSHVMDGIRGVTTPVPAS